MLQKKTNFCCNIVSFWHKTATFDGKTAALAAYLPFFSHASFCSFEGSYFFFNIVKTRCAHSNHYFWRLFKCIISTDAVYRSKMNYIQRGGCFSLMLISEIIFLFMELFCSTLLLKTVFLRCASALSLIFLYKFMFPWVLNFI